MQTEQEVDDAPDNPMPAIDFFMGRAESISYGVDVFESQKILDRELRCGNGAETFRQVDVI